MNPRIPYLIMSTIFVIFLIVFNFYGLTYGYKMSTFKGGIWNYAHYFVVGVVIFWYSNLIIYKFGIGKYISKNIIHEKDEIGEIKK